VQKLKKCLKSLTETKIEMKKGEYEDKAET